MRRGRADRRAGHLTGGRSLAHTHRADVAHRARHVAPVAVGGTAHDVHLAAVGRHPIAVFKAGIAATDAAGPGCTARGRIGHGAPLAAGAAVVHVGGKARLAAVVQHPIAVVKAGIAAADAASPGRAARRRIGHSAPLAAGAAVVYVSGKARLAAVVQHPIAVVKAGITTADAAVAVLADRAAVYDGGAGIAAGATVVQAGGRVGLAAVDGAGLAGPIGGDAAREDAGSGSAGGVADAARGAGVFARAAVGEVGRAVDLAAVTRVAVAIEVAAQADDLALTSRASRGGVCSTGAGGSTGATVLGIAPSIGLATIGSIKIALGKTGITG